MMYLFKDQSGMSLVELLAAIGILLMVLSGIYSLYLTGLNSWERNISAMENRAETEIAIKQISRDLMKAEYASEAIPLLEIADKDEIIFYSDVDDDSQPEKIRYYTNEAEIHRAVYKPINQTAPWEYSDVTTEKIVSNNIRNSDAQPIFRYYASPAQEYDSFPLDSQSRASIRLINIYLKVDNNPNRLPPPIELEYQVYLRNVK